MSADSFITPDWPIPSHVNAVITTRQGGVSPVPFDSFNLADHINDVADNVEHNRQQLIKQLQLPNAPLWIQQVHGTRVIKSNEWHLGVEADASYSNTPKQICTVLTADCLPILLCNTEGTEVAAIHAGWRSLLNGIIEKTINNFTASPNDILVYLGPAIGPQQFQVKQDMVDAFCHYSTTAASAFIQQDEEHYLADIYELAKQRLAQCNVSHIYGGNRCTVTEKSQFFSFRRDDVTGRMASLIWIN